jgi:hypothetical protein
MIFELPFIIEYTPTIASISYFMSVHLERTLFEVGVVQNALLWPDLGPGTLSRANLDTYANFRLGVSTDSGMFLVEVCLHLSLVQHCVPDARHLGEITNPEVVISGEPLYLFISRGQLAKLYPRSFGHAGVDPDSRERPEMGQHVSLGFR